MVAVGIGGDEYEKELRTALAMGADRAVLVECGQLLDPWNVARLLRAVVNREKPELVLMGKQAVDDDANQTGQFLAALLDWPQATFASKLEFVDGSTRISDLAETADRRSADDCETFGQNRWLGQETGHSRSLRVDRETDAGIESIQVPLPAVVTTDLRLNEPRYASLPSILKAKKKPIERVPFEELNVELQPRLRILSMEAPPTKHTGVRVQDVDELLRRLRDEAEVISCRRSTP